MTVHAASKTDEVLSSAAGGRYERFAPLALRYARIALGISFLSAVADRFGLLGKYGGWGDFATFTAYTAKVNSFMPSATIPFLAWAATLGETVFGVALVLYGVLPRRMTQTGLWPRAAALGSAILLLLFALAMSLSLSLKKPLDYSVFSASACALLLALWPEPRS